MVAPSLRWLGLGLSAAVLVVGTHFVWPSRAGAGSGSPLATVTYGWLKRPGPRGPNVSVDLYSPPESSRRAPLVVLLQGNEPSQPDERLAFAASIGDSLQRKGVATAAVSFNIHQGYTLRACAAEVAGIVREAMGAHDATRLVLVGRGLGAWMAAMLALDRRLLQGAGLDPRRVDGVIVVRGTYDLGQAALDGHPDAAFLRASVEDRKESSPITYVRADAPPFLILSGGQDEDSWARIARPFARALRNTGARSVDYFVVPERDAHSIVHWAGRGNDLGDLVFGFVASGPKELPIDNPFGVRRRWGVRPPLDLSEFRKDPQAIATYPVDDGLRQTLMLLFGTMPYELYPLPMKTYQAIDLLDYLARRPESEVGKGDWLVVSNIRGESQYFAREVLVKARPVIVVGLDDEDNLYRVFNFYRLNRAYSWVEGEEPMPMMIRPLGAFLHFPTPPPEDMRNATFAPFGLDPTSFHWVEQDPLAPVRSLTGGLREAMIGTQGCLKCHAFRGAGARAHHALADSGKSYGAYALPFEEYPTDVMRRFLFEQEKVAKSFGVVPLPVEQNVARQIFDLVEREKPRKTN
jgi:acetyl esterase/lipase